jgi:hypothetical protein
MHTGTNQVPKQQIEDKDTAIEHSAPLRNIAPPKSRRVPRWVPRVVVVGLMAIAAEYIYRTFDPEHQALANIRALVESKYLISPASAHWIENRIINHQGSWWASYLEVDSQNTNGVLVRSRLCVAIELRGGQFLYRPGMSIQDNCNPDDVAAIKLWLDMQGWGKPIIVGREPDLPASP